MDEPTAVDPEGIAAGLRIIRKRRWFLWSLIIVYVPAVWTSLTLTHSDRATGIVFGVWLILLISAVWLVTAARCPRCGNLFHMHGITPLYLRKCLHCQLHVCTDKHT
jgi:hypothetical protein